MSGWPSASACSPRRQRCAGPAGGTRARSRAVIDRHPELDAVVGPYVDQMLATHRCLVHGDYSPKNVLLGDDGLWVLDFEVGHLGDPVFDVAFLLNHLLLKAIHRPVAID